MKNKCLSILLFFVSFYSTAQTPVYNVFKSTRVINGHSTNMLWKNELDFRITHRFGDIGGGNGGFSTFYGLDNASDIRIAFEYGLTNNLMIGFGRIKGNAFQRQNLDGFIKYRILQQSDKVPVSMVFLGTSLYTLMNVNADSTSAFSFANNLQRFSFSSQLIISRKFSERITLQFAPTYVHRNYVAYDDKNGMLALGFQAKFQVTKMFGILAEYFYLTTRNSMVNGVNRVDPLSIGFEFDTGGHVFHVNFTNSRSIGDALFIPNTVSQWSRGQFRLGFNISRIFKF